MPSTSSSTWSRGRRRRHGGRRAPWRRAGHVDQGGVEIDAAGDGGVQAPARGGEAHGAARRRRTTTSSTTCHVGTDDGSQAELLEEPQGAGGQPVAAALVAREARLVDDDDVRPPCASAMAAAAPAGPPPTTTTSTCTGAGSESADLADLVDALEQAGLEDVGVGDGRGVGVHADVDLVEVADERDVRGRAGLSGPNGTCAPGRSPRRTPARAPGTLLVTKSTPLSIEPNSWVTSVVGRRLRTPAMARRT